MALLLLQGVSATITVETKHLNSVSSTELAVGEENPALESA